MFVFSNGIAINLYEILWMDKITNNEFHAIYIYFKQFGRQDRVTIHFNSNEQVEIEFDNLIERLNQILNKERD